MSTLLPGGLPVEGESQRPSYLCLYIPLIVMLQLYMLRLLYIARVQIISKQPLPVANICVPIILLICQRKFASHFRVHVKNNLID